ncbi:hypothetical protein P280DRAFT_487086 [Massarina eburnea CBS 473.64]|uniref:Molybdopterin synthase sulfur carrier subunit n=1 Tax=Massarina eburnea CBS 473.64 TaxID=1395130 RepID=A0A6A6S9Q8_9PLEO|nr:hypothetical protein P280DRAFT_487086 [Massarina eburnea CBS 473.64]
MASSKAPAGHFSILYFAAASSFTAKSSEHLPAPLEAGKLFATLEERYPGITAKVLGSCAVTVNLEYVDVDVDVDVDGEDGGLVISEGDEVAVIPPFPSSLPSLPSLPPRALPQQPYTAGPALQSPQQPYYVPTPPPAPPNAFDPALAQTSPTQHESPEDDDLDDHDDHDEHDDHATHGPGDPKSPNDLKRPRACDSCRGLKVRCDQARLDLPCKRCAKANRTCITTPPTRKRQKKADSRVAELERKIDALTATLHAQKEVPPELRHHTGIPLHGQEASPYQPGPEGVYRASSLVHDWSDTPPQQAHYEAPPGYAPAQNPQREPPSKRRRLDRSAHNTIPEDMDAVHRDLAEHPEMKRGHKKGIQPDYSHINGLIDSLMAPETAERIFDRYVDDICPHFPAVPFNPGTKAREVRDKKPLLFLSILAGSSHGAAEQLVTQEVQQALTKLLKDQFADIIWRNGEKSLEIVQALQVGVLWYRPPLHYEQHNFYMMVNCAAVMALDLGLGRRNTPTVMKLAVGPFKRCHPNASSVESRRTFLVCYYLCMSITMVLRRPILLRWTKYMEESIKILETSPDALPSDKILCQHVKMARIGENISVQFCMDDPSVEVAISEPKVVYALKIFENELTQLREEHEKQYEHVEPAIRLAQHVTNLYVHEIALHHNQSVADFHPPFPQESFTSGVGQKEAVGPAHIGALGECLTATHGILDTILSVPLDILLTFPVIFCVRAIYAIVCLMKMWVSVTSSGEVGNIIKKEHLQIETYTERLVNMFYAIVSRDAQSPHGKFYFVAKHLQERFAHIKEGASRTEQSSDANDDSRSSTAQPTSKRDSTHTQTPLHLLSEVAMGSSNTSTPAQVQGQSQPQQQQQPPTAVQQQSRAPPQQSIQGGWYPGMSQPQQSAPDVSGMPYGIWDPNFDFTQFDLSTGSDAELSALFIPDSLMWSYASNYDGPPPQQQQQQQQGYGGF